MFLLRLGSRFTGTGDADLPAPLLKIALEAAKNEVFGFSLERSPFKRTSFQTKNRTQFFWFGNRPRWHTHLQSYGPRLQIDFQLLNQNPKKTVQFCALMAVRLNQRRKIPNFPHYPHHRFFYLLGCHAFTASDRSDLSIQRV